MIADKLKLMASIMPEEVIAVYLYGSAVKGRLREESDIDIAILPSYKVPEEERLGLMARVEGSVDSLLREVGIQRPISILDLRGKFVSLTLQYRVITQGKLLFEKDPSERIEFENAVKGEYFDFNPFIQSLRKKKYGHIRQKV